MSNTYGVCDLGGNLWEWCEDLHEDGAINRVLRGASWNSNARGHVLSSNRHHSAPGLRNFNDRGFRCILAPAPSTSPKP